MSQPHQPPSPAGVIGASARPHGGGATTAARRSAVIEAALGVIEDQHDLTMESVAERAGVGRATVFRYFTSRELLVEAVVEEIIDRARAATLEAMDGRCGPEDLLRASAMVAATFGARYAFMASVRPVVGGMSSRGLPYQKPLEDWIRHAVKTGELRSGLDPAWVSRVIFTLGVAASDALAEGVGSEDDIQTWLSDTLIHAFMAPQILPEGTSPGAVGAPE